MPQTVEIPDQGIAEFPDDMTPDDIKGVIQKKFYAPSQPTGVETATAYGQQQGAPTVEEQKQMVSDIPAAVRNPLEAAVETVGGFIPKTPTEIAGFATPLVGAVEGVYKAGKSLSDVLFGGKTIAQAEAENYPEAALLSEAEKTPPFSKERYKAGFNVIGQLGMAALIGRSLTPKPGGLHETLTGETETSPEVASVNEGLAQLEKEIQNAIQEPQPTQPDGVRSEPQVPQEIEAPPANISGEGVSEVGQRTEVSGGTQEAVAPSVPQPEQPTVSSVETPPTVAETDATRQATPGIEPPPLNKDNPHYEQNALGRAHKLAQGFVWNGENWVHPDYPNATPFSSDVPPPKSVDVQAELAKIKGESVQGTEAKSVSAPTKIGDPIQFTEPSVAYRNGEPITVQNKKVGRVTLIKPDGGVEVKAQDGSYRVFTPEEIAKETGKLAPVPKAEGATTAVPEWKISGRKGEMASTWETEGASINLESRKKGAGTGGKRYVATVGDEQYGALNLESAKAWAESKLKPSPVSQPNVPTTVEPQPKPEPVSPPPTEPPAPVEEPFGFGPGAAAKGETLAPTSQIRQLSEIASSVEKSRPEAPLPDLVSEVKTAVDRTIGTVQDKVATTRDTVHAAWRVLHDRYLRPPVEGDFKNALKDWQGADQKTSFYVRDFVKNVNKSIPNKLDQEAIVNWIQANGDKNVLAERASKSKPQFKAGYEAATKLTPEQETFAQNTQQYLEAMLTDGRNAGILEHGVENYINQVWKRPNKVTQELQAAVQSGKLNTNFQFAKKRIFDSYFDGEQAGQTPAGKNISSLIAAYDLAFNKALSARAFVKSLRESKAADGEPIVRFSGMSSEVPKGEEVPEAYLIRQTATPPAAVTVDGRPYKSVDHPALRGWKWALETPEGIPAYMQSDMLVHPDYVNQLKNVLGSSWFRHNPITRTALQTGSLLKQTRLSLSLFHLDQEALHGLFHRVNPANLEKIDFDNPAQMELVRGGLQVADYRSQELFSEGLTGGGLVSKIPGLGRVQDLFNDFLFRDYIPRLKMTMAMHAFERNLKRYPSLSRDQIAELTAAQGNAAFGELNYKLLARNPSMQDFLRLTTLAPDFLEARGRFVSQALRPYGGEQRAALFLMGATVFATSKILNQVLDGDPHWDKHPFSVYYKGREYRLRTVLGDVQELATDPNRFFYNRFSPWLRSVTELATGRDYRGIKRTGPEQIKDLASWLLPIPVAPSPDSNVPQRLMQSAGVASKPYTAQTDTYDMARKFMESQTDPKVKAMVKRKEQETYAESDYKPLRRALDSENEKSARSEYQKLREQGKTHKQIATYFGHTTRPFTGSNKTEEKFRSSMTPEQKRTYQKALQERQDSYRKFIRLFGGKGYVPKS